MEQKKVYIILYEYGLGGTVIDVYTDGVEAVNKCKKLNGTGLRNGTYSVVEKELK